MGPAAGTLMANGALAVLTVSTSDTAFLDRGWRVAFLLSAIFVAIGLLIRLRLEDTPVFRGIRDRGDRGLVAIRNAGAFDSFGD